MVCIFLHVFIIKWPSEFSYSIIVRMICMDIV
jgi:hypothetical protein